MADIGPVHCFKLSQTNYRSATAANFAIDSANDQVTYILLVECGRSNPTFGG